MLEGTLVNKQPSAKAEPVHVHYSVLRELFLPCPFCGEEPNVFQVPETRYGPKVPFGWIVECKNMGCIYHPGSPDQSLKHLMEWWNKRV
jgi:hypothetical protein